MKAPLVEIISPRLDKVLSNGTQVELDTLQAAGLASRGPFQSKLFYESMKIIPSCLDEYSSNQKSRKRQLVPIYHPSPLPFSLHFSCFFAKSQTHNFLQKHPEGNFNIFFNYDNSLLFTQHNSFSHFISSGGTPNIKLRGIQTSLFFADGLYESCRPKDALMISKCSRKCFGLGHCVFLHCTYAHFC